MQKNIEKIEILPKLKIYGYSEIEDVILAGLVTGYPVLLVGKHGSAKTMLAESLARSLGLNFIAYDASKALFDDVIGYPNPLSLQNGMIEYIPTPLSIWDKEFILIDEISRATPSMQNKWLEIIRARRVMGKEITSLKYIFAAMNPPGEYIGATELDPALLGRFAFIIHVPEVQQMDSNVVRQIINNVSRDDAVCISSLHTNNNIKCETLSQLIENARNIIPQVQNQYQNFITNYVHHLLGKLQEVDFKLDGRRLVMIRLNLLAYLSIAVVKYGDKYVKDNLDSLIFHCVKYSLPLTNEEKIEDLFPTLPMIHKRIINEISDGILPKKHIKGTSNDIGYVVETFISNYDKLSHFEKQNLISILLLSSNEIKEEKLADYVISIRKLLKFLLTKPDENLDFLYKVVKLYRGISSITDRRRNVELYTAPFCVDRDKFVTNVIPLDDPNTDIAYRAILNIPIDKDNAYSRQRIEDNIDNNFFVKLNYLIQQMKKLQQEEENKK